MEGQQFCLRWHNFQNTLLSSLPKLLDGGYLTDVTLSAGGRHIRAHRIILSACSQYFKELFKDLSALQHPVIILPGMEYANLCALVTFMYNGEVNIYQEQLPALLAMADTLHIRGLADIAGKTTCTTNSNGIFIDQPPRQPELIKKDLNDAPTIKKELIVEGTSIDDCSSEAVRGGNHHSELQAEADDTSIDNEEIPCSVKTKPYYSINAKLSQKEKKQCTINNGPLLGRQTEKTCINSSSNMDENILVMNENQSCSIDDSKTSIIDTNFRYLTTTTPASTTTTTTTTTTITTGNRINQTCSNKTSVTCLICGKQLSNQYNLRVHMETHSNSSYSCTACSHISRSRDALRKHVSYRHPVTPPQKRPRYNNLSKP